jgi:hypothetical protein
MYNIPGGILPILHPHVEIWYKKNPPAYTGGNFFLQEVISNYNDITKNG